MRWGFQSNSQLLSMRQASATGDITPNWNQSSTTLEENGMKLLNDLETLEKQTNGDKSSNALKENVKNNANKMIL